MDRPNTDEKEENVPDDTLLDEISRHLEGEEETSGPLPAKLAEIIEKRWHNKLAPNKLTEKLEKYLKPENCKKLATPRVNKNIWTKLGREVKSRDLTYSQPQKHSQLREGLLPSQLLCFWKPEQKMCSQKSVILLQLILTYWLYWVTQVRTLHNSDEITYVCH
ncbi:MAG: hypothetical protein GY893_06165 [bacterium]|nr:hypothetical protein [bacterium]